MREEQSAMMAAASESEEEVVAPLMDKDKDTKKPAYVLAGDEVVSAET